MAFLRQAKRLFIGDPLSNEMAQHQRIPKWKALAVLSSDALSSVAYASEEVLIPLSLFTIAAMAWSIPIAIAVVVLLIVVTISYQQTIDSYPSGGGAYIVAKENLGTNAGLVAGAALLIDYVLTVAVSVAAGVENIVSAFPSLTGHNEMIGFAVILLLMVFNLRGVRESASVFAIPTYLFIGSFVLMIAVGIWKLVTGQAQPMAPLIHETYPEIPVFLLLRAFASGCAALTGIEAISNGIPMFEKPAQRNAKITMMWMSFILASLFAAITLLAHVYGIVPTHGVTAISQLASSIFGKNVFYYLIQAATALILILAANTAYADFPRLASLLAKDRFLPRQLASQGDRLVFSNGILGLSVVASCLIALFQGHTHSLIPLYAVGVFLSFTLSQSGMIMHHLRLKHKGWIKSLLFNLLGAATTFVVLTVIAITKFAGGAWMVILLIPSMVFVFHQIRRHYVQTARNLALAASQERGPVTAQRHIAIVPVSGIHPGVLEALRYALSVAKDVRACSVEADAESAARMRHQWAKMAPEIPLIMLKSPYRSIITPVLEYVDLIEKENPNNMLTVVIPEFVTEKWYHQFLHNQTAIFLYASLRAKRGVIVTSVRYHLGQVQEENPAL